MPSVLTKQTSKHAFFRNFKSSPLYMSFYLGFLNTPPWSSDRDPQRRFPPSSNVSALWISWRFRGGRIRWSAGCPCWFFLSFGTHRLPLAMRGSLWPSYDGHCCLDWSDFRKLSMASSCRILHALTCNLRLCEALFGLFMSIASIPVAYSGHESSQWLFHTVYLIYANWAL